MNARSIVLFSLCVPACISDAPGDEASQDPDSSTAIQAVINDDFSIPTTDACGRVDFVDFGPGDPSNSANNDDYFVIHDLCPDSHGIRASYNLTRNGSVIDTGTKYNGNGFDGPPVYWDPFPSGNVSGGDVLDVTVCLVDGPNGTGFKCENIV